MERVSQVNACSNVCGLYWNKNANQIVSAHGSPGNNVSIWTAPDLRWIGSVLDSDFEIPYLAASPSGMHIAAGLGLMSSFPMSASSGLSFRKCESEDIKNLPTVRLVCTSCILILYDVLMFTDAAGYDPFQVLPNLKTDC